MAEINLLELYPHTKRNLENRQSGKNPQVQHIARQFGKEYFDGDRLYGYGGYHYHPRFWQPVVPVFQKYYNLTKESSILDAGRAKGFMLHDFVLLIPGIKVKGIDISSYAIDNALGDVKPYLQAGNVKDLPFADQSFDLVISINTIHNLPLGQCKKALREIQRVTKKHAFITVDAYRNEEEKKRMEMWNLTAQTYMHVDDWVKLFKETGYTGDYYWFIP